MSQTDYYDDYYADDYDDYDSYAYDTSPNVVTCVVRSDAEPSAHLNNGSPSKFEATTRESSLFTDDRIRRVSAEEILQEMTRRAQQVSSAVNLPPSAALLWLRQHQWSVDDATAALLTDEAGSAFLSQHEGELEATKWEWGCSDTSDTTECCICCCSFAASTLRRPDTCPVDHQICDSCWRMQIEEQRSRQGLVYFRCFASTKCHTVVNFTLLSDLAPSTDTYRSWLKSYLGDFIKRTASLVRCPNCDFCIMLVPPSQLSNNSFVECMQCHKPVCSHCGMEDHAPCTCAELREWQVKMDDGGANIAFIQGHTKKCPCCNESIEKNQGCNHMKCRCGHEFCWTCLSEWAEHTKENTFTCPYSPKNSSYTETGSEPTHFSYCLARVQAHEDSAKYEWRDLDYMHSTIVLYFEEAGCSHVQAENKYNKLRDLLVRARAVLQRCYIHEFFVANNEVFKHMRGALEGDTERLSNLLMHLKKNDTLPESMEDVMTLADMHIKALLAE